MSKFIPYWATTLGITNHGWFSRADALQTSKQLDSIVYHLSFAENIPTSNEHPYWDDTVVYIGKSGGKSDNLTFDDKRGTRIKTTPKTTAHMRLLSHMSSIKRKNNKKYALLRSLLDANGGNIWVHIFTFNPNVTPEERANQLAEIDVIEKECLILCKHKFQRAPMGNLDQNPHNSKRLPGSFSARESKRATLISFL